MKNEVQEIYINLDDSGKLTAKEKISAYGGLVFLSKKEKDKFITQYKSIINDIKCGYCENKEDCNHICPEIKNTNIKNNCSFSLFVILYLGAIDFTQNKFSGGALWQK